MPLVVMCGHPSSGKSTRARELSEHLSKEHGKTVHIVNEDTLSLEKNQVYKSSHAEKAARGSLKAHVERLLNRDSVVILDSLNYIKGYRYELYCVARALATTHCVVYCGVGKDRVREFNAQRPQGEQYTPEILEELLMRFEEPDSRQRWDRPLFLVVPEDTMPVAAIAEALLAHRPPPPNQATAQPVAPDTNYLHELDRVTQTIANALLEAQKTAVVGDEVPVPNSDAKVRIKRHVTLSELMRLRRQFVSVQRLHSLQSAQRIGPLFVEFLNNTM
eukprot:comp18113_c1_seq1/m.18777 comp18113_c1_seq1/g.18777  ORF comp18113_c1_seq1/g.18777 comp18113_c1_seq1/m.18777 type:complete len:275 (-) comp18113_c1_seq1:164-988(-)